MTPRFIGLPNGPLVHFGTVELMAKALDDEAHRRIIFDPIPRVDGIEPSDDPLLELRVAICLLTKRPSPAPCYRIADGRFANGLIEVD
jgi:hypothetical protein